MAVEYREVTRENIVDAIAVIGKYIADNAENFVAKDISRMAANNAIQVSFKLSADECPHIVVSSEFICYEAVHELFKKSISIEE